MKIAFIGEFHEIGINFAKEKKIECIETLNYEEESLVKILQDVDAIGVRTSKLTRNILKKCLNLKIVARHGVGYDAVDLDYLNERKIPLAITGTSNAVAVAEHVLMMFLSLSKKITFADSLVKNGNFSKKTLIHDTYELYQKNIFILGFGRIGKEVAKRCLAFDTNVFIYDPFVQAKDVESLGCKLISFEEGIKIADYITLHMPLNTKTKNLIAKNELQEMKKNCILVNTARGGIINQNDLIEALNNNNIFGSGLDVFSPEPPKLNDPILKTKNLILTPHNAALTLECRKRMSMETVENIIFHLENKTNKMNIINKEVL